MVVKKWLLKSNCGFDRFTFLGNVKLSFVFCRLLAFEI